MKTLKSMSPGIPQHDYRAAIQGALSWLGDRYLLAEPLNPRSEDRKVEVSKPQHTQTGSPGVGVMA
jgi:hypothetical protein